MVVAQATNIMKPLATLTAHVIPIEIYTDDSLETRQNITGYDIDVFINSQQGWRKYDASITGAATGDAQITLLAVQHDTAGEWAAQLHIDGKLMRRYTLTFFDKATIVTPTPTPSPTPTPT